MIVAKDSFEITGMYGDKWKIEDIEEVTLLDEMPEVTWKINGYGLSTTAKGVFKVKEYGRSLLFIKKESPYIYIKVGDQHVFINGGSPEETKEWYEELAG
ncbi:PH domain-containing protein [Rossellomorea oryzaecorticis]|uniref:PH domain-containing protein n=1 Tax=Rossellomorea oryzaecorticis TaxID=1396505 RepID=A0ABU9K754_9BACI